MIEARLEGKKVVAKGEEAKELYENGWYGKLADEKLELELVEAALLCERGRIEITDEAGTKLSFKDFFHACSERDERFSARYVVYKDLRERGLPVRTGFKGSDFRVYERGVKPSKAEQVKWIVFAETEDYPCKFELLEKASKLAQNIRTIALWAIVDDDMDCTYYIISEIAP